MFTMANHRSLLAGLQVFLIVSSTVMTALRFVARFFSKAGLWWDDYVVFLALVRRIVLLVSRNSY